MSPQYFFFILCVGVVYAQDSPITLPPEIMKNISEGQIKNKTAQVLKEMCDKNGGPDAYPAVENALTEFQSCLGELIDYQVVQDEIEKAKPNGEMDEVFKKYCDKKPEFKSCFVNLTDVMHECYTSEERGNLKTVYNVTEQLAEFICFKDGDRIALFIAEHGPECIQEKQPGIQRCVNETMGGGVTLDPKDLTSLNMNSLPKIRFGEKECNQLTDFQKCVVHELETCSSTTSANIIESLFKFIRKATPCGELAEEEEINARKLNNVPQNSAASLVLKSITMGAMVITFLI